MQRLIRLPMTVHFRRIANAPNRLAWCRACTPRQIKHRETAMSQAPLKDASHLYEVERRAQHAARPGFRITELQLSPTQKVPWHTHTNVSDTFYVLEG